MASSSHIYYSGATPLNHYPSSSSHVPTTRGPHPSPYYVNDTANTLEAFAEVNRALASRNARQSLPRPRQTPQGPRGPRAPNPEIIPYRPKTLKKEQLPQDTSQLYPPFMHAHTSREQGVINPRFSTASSPTALYPEAPYPDRPVFPSSNGRETGRYEGYPRGPTSEGHARPARPVLKLITPSSPQWATVSAPPRRERTFQDMGYHSTSLKDRSSCVIM